MSRTRSGVSLRPVGRDRKRGADPVQGRLPRRLAHHVGHAGHFGLQFGDVLLLTL